MSNKNRFSRRSMLRGILGGATVGVALPTLEIFMNDSGTAYADGSAFPRRFVSWFWGNGAHHTGWVPPEEGAGVTDLTSEQFQWSSLWEPLRRHAAKMTGITGFDVKTSGQIPHESAVAGVFSGASLLVEGERQIWQAPSIDQLIAEEVGRQTAYRSLHFAGTGTTQAISYRGENQPNPSVNSPFQVYQDLFTDGFRLPGEGGMVDPSIALRRSVLDAVAEDSQRLKARLGYTDRIRMDQHFTAIRELELRLKRLEEDPPSYEACALPSMPPETIGTDERGRPQVGLRNQLMAEMAAMALACDQTRVLTYVLSKSVGDVVFPIDGLELEEDGMGVLKGHHELTHNEPNEEMWRVTEIVLYIMDRLAEFVDALDAIPEGDGTLLDNTLVYASSDASNPRTHSLRNFPVLLFGGAGGRVKMGTHIHGNSDNVSKILMSAARAMGVNLASIGLEDGLADDGVPELEPDA